MRAITIGLAFAALLGCGKGQEPGAVVEGTVTMNGAPHKLGDSEGVTITLAGGDETYTASASESGTFSVQKPAGGPIPYGSYKVKYTHYQNQSPYTRKAPFKVERPLPEPWEVSATNSKFTIDLGKK